MITPPEWPTWGWGSRLAYVVSITCFLALIFLGAQKLHELLQF